MKKLCTECAKPSHRTRLNKGYRIHCRRVDQSTITSQHCLKPILDMKTYPQGLLFGWTRAFFRSYQSTELPPPFPTVGIPCAAQAANMFAGMVKFCCCFAPILTSLCVRAKPPPILTGLHYALSIASPLLTHLAWVCSSPVARLLRASTPGEKDSGELEQALRGP